ncbi:MAG TPA: hypothetical protein VMZ91_14365 [Candidatus Paceibacterota bacterium]|nr:hypothetical protein [Candidatus Paceibacterota bacterium]
MKIKDKKATTEMTMGKLITIILVLIVLVLVIVGFATGLFNPLVSKTRDMYNSVLAPIIEFLGFEGVGAGKPTKEITLFGEKRIMSFDESKAQCEVDIGDKELQGLKGKYAVRYNQGERKYELYYYKNNDWENIDKNIPTAEGLNLRYTFDALNKALDSLTLNFEGKTYKIYLTEFGLGIFYVQQGGRDDIAYHYKPGNLMKPSVSSEWLNCNDASFSVSEKELCDDFYDSVYNYKFLFLGEERTLSLEEVDRELVIYTNIGNSYYGIGLNDYGKKELYVKYPNNEWSQKKDLTYTTSKENSYLYTQDTAEKLSTYKQLKDDLIRECENW